MRSPFFEAGEVLPPRKLCIVIVVFFGIPSFSIFAGENEYFSTGSVFFMLLSLKLCLLLRENFCFVLCLCPASLRINF